MFSRSLLATVLAATALAAPSPAAEHRPVGDSFELIALHSTSAVHLQAVNANGKSADLGNGFYVGRPTFSYCPESQGVPCPAGTSTGFTVGDEGRITLDASVPGGQLVYIDKFGVLRFTAAHTGGDTPEDSVLGGWTYVPPTPGQVIGSLTRGKNKFFACPAQNEGYRIFVKYAHHISIPSDCISIDLGARPVKGFTAFQYL